MKKKKFLCPVREYGGSKFSFISTKFYIGNYLYGVCVCVLVHFFMGVFISLQQRQRIQSVTMATGHVTGLRIQLFQLLEVEHECGCVEVDTVLRLSHLRTHTQQLLQGSAYI